MCGSFQGVLTSHSPPSKGIFSNLLLSIKFYVEPKEKLVFALKTKVSQNWSQKSSTEPKGIYLVFQKRVQVFEEEFCRGFSKQNQNQRWNEHNLKTNPNFPL